MNKINLYLCLTIIFFINCEGPLFDVPSDEDTIPPTLTITYPADQSILSDTVLITAYAFDNVELDTVEIYLNDSIIHSSKEGPFSYVWITTNFEEDTDHTIRAKAIDHQGNVNYTNTIRVIVDNQDNSPPSGSFIFPFTGQTLNGEITIIVEANDNEEVSSVILYLDGDSVETFTEPPYEYTWNTVEELDDIIYTIHAYVIDNNSNQVTLGPINVLIDNNEPYDNIPPTGSITAPASASTISGVIDINVNAFDDVKMGYVDFIIDGSLVFKDSIPPFTFSWNTLTEIEDANHIINVNLADSIGNTTILYPINVYVNNTTDPDNISPNIAIYEPAANQTVMDTVAISTIATDNVGIERVEFYHDYNLEHTANSYPYTYEWNTLTSVEESQHVWYVKAFDTSGNESQTQPISVNIDNQDNIPPSGFISFPYAGQEVNGNVEIQLSANDNIGVVKADFFINGELILTDTEEPFIYEWNTLIEEENLEYILFASIYDYGENQVNLNPIVVTVNNDDILINDIAPPFASILTPLSSQTVSDTVLISGFATDNVSIHQVKYFINDSLIATLEDTPFTKKWNTYLLPNNSEQIIRMIAQDPSGNESIAQPIYVVINNEYDQTISNLSLISEEGSNLLSWDSPFNAHSYKIYRDSTFLTELSDQSYTDYVEAGLEYCYTISPVNSVNIEGIQSEEICGVPILASPGSFIGILNYDNIILTWEAVDNATEYQIVKNDELLWNGNDLTFTDSDLIFSTTYNYKIYAIDVYENDGTYSEVLTFTTLTEVTPPTLAISITGSSATLNWTSIDVAESYRVYQDDNFLLETTDLTHELDIGTLTNTCFTITSINELGTESIVSNEECGSGS